jgi:hypothetical protein
MAHQYADLTLVPDHLKKACATAPEGIGPTGQYPTCKLGERDEGEIAKVIAESLDKLHAEREKAGSDGMTDGLRKTKLNSYFYRESGAAMTWLSSCVTPCHLTDSAPIGTRNTSQRESH